MTNNQNPAPRFASHAERLAYYSNARLDTPPVMPAKVNRPAPRPRRNSVKHRSIR
jgi:hypothetical protein